jgi:hypothetical protein
VVGGAAILVEDIVKAAVASGAIKVACFRRAESGAAFLAVSERTLAVRKELGQFLAAIMAFFARGFGSVDGWMAVAGCWILDAGFGDF